MGQCLEVLEEVVPSLPIKLADKYPELSVPSDILPGRDRTAWNRILLLRNRLAHGGPGFLDSVDLASGRIWREYKVDVPLEQQAVEVWRLGRQLCRSPLIVLCVALQGVTPEAAQEQLDRAELIRLTLTEVSSSLTQTIASFHARVSALGE